MTLTFSVNGQNEVKKPSDEATRRIQLGIRFSPTLTYYTLTPAEDNQHMTARQTYTDSHSPAFGYVAGLDFCYQVTKHIGIETGVQYSVLSIKRDALTYFPSLAINQVKNAVHFHHHFVNIPVGLRFVVGQGKVRFKGGVGITTDIYTTSYSVQKIIWKSGQKTTNRKNFSNGVRVVNISPTVSAGIDIVFSDKFGLSFQPTLRHNALSSYPLNTDIYSWTLGLDIVFYLRL